MPSTPFDVVTGAFGYIGKYITRRLLERGRRILTLTGQPNQANPFGSVVRAAPFNFDKPHLLARSLRRAGTLYNTYWVRFCRGSVTFDQAVENTRALVRAARDAGVGRIVHVSITNPSVDSPLPYFRGKAQLEEFIAASGLSYALVRPTVVFGDEDILINNIAWLLRRLPLFIVPGSGDYRLQPVSVEDLAEIVVAAGERQENAVIDAVGPEVFRFDELVRLIAKRLRIRARVVHLPARLALFAARLIGYALGDVMLTREEIDGLTANLLVSDRPATGARRLSDWLERRADHVGRQYASELKRHFR